jgi:hypothetical protein
LSSETSPSRLEYLRTLETLTDAEMNELIALSPSGIFKDGGNFADLGVVDVGRAFANLKEGAARSKHAYAHGCYIEVLSLRLQHTDLWLRMFWVWKNKKGKIFEAEDKRTFGVLIHECESLGFDKAMVVRMRDFNDSRVDAIHKYLLGVTDYLAIKLACDSHLGLDKDVGDYVRAVTGAPL